jgi:YVTN family beta-propeller protein
VVLLVIAAAVAYGVYRSSSGGRTNTAYGETTIPSMSLGVALASGSTGHGDGGSGSAGVTTTEDTSPLSTAPQALSVETVPADAKVTVKLQDGTIVSATAPFSQTIPGGRVTVSVSKKGYNTTTKRLALVSEQSLKMWLDREGQMLQSVVRFKCGRQPKQVLFTPDGKELWVSLLAGTKAGLEAYDPLTGEKVASVALGGQEAVELIMTRDGKTIFASQMSTSTVWVVDRGTRKVLRHFSSGGDFSKVLLLSPDEKTLYVSNWLSNDVSEIDPATGKFRRLIKTVATPRGLYVTPDSKWLYVAGFGHGEIQKIDLATGKGTVIFKTGGSMRHVAADETKNVLYVGEFVKNDIYVVDLATDEVTKLADTDHRPNTIDLSPDGKVLYVSNRGKDNPKSYLIKGPEWGSVLAIDTASGKILDAIVGGNQCTGLDVSPDGTLLAFSDFLDYVIRIYAIPSYEELAAGNGGRAATRLQDIIKD